MREVPVPTGIAAPSCRHAIALIAAWLVALQAFLAGVATAQAAAMLAAPAAIDVICHGSGNGGGATDGTAPETAKIEHLCCVFCTSAAPAQRTIMAGRSRNCGTRSRSFDRTA